MNMFGSTAIAGSAIRATATETDPVFAAIEKRRRAQR